MRPAPLAVQVVEEGGRRYVIEWFNPPWCPPLAETTQVYGVCFTPAGKILLVEQERDSWQLPGGGIEDSETFVETLRREVMEEARARVLDAEYIGCQRITETDLNGEPVEPSNQFDSRARRGVPFYQVRFWARVELDEWEDAADSFGRVLVDPDDFMATLFWGSTPTASLIFENAMKVEAGDTRG